MRFIKNVFLGLVIGIAAITPGLSGGSLAATIGLYEPIINAINSLAKNFAPNARFLLPLALGGALGVMAFSNVMAELMLLVPDQVKLLSIGLVAGSLPSLLKQANAKGFSWPYPLVALVAVIFVYELGSLPLLGAENAERGAGAMLYAYCGLIYAVGSIVPGISSSIIFMHLGVYEDLLRAVAGLDLSVLFPAALGLGAGGLLLVHLVAELFRRFYAPTYYAVIGFLLGSALLIVPSMQSGWPILLDAVVLLFGISLSLMLLKLSTGSK